jgi:hypothetical protein
MTLRVPLWVVLLSLALTALSFAPVIAYGSITWWGVASCTIACAGAVLPWWWKATQWRDTAQRQLGDAIERALIAEYVHKGARR